MLTDHINDSFHNIISHALIKITQKYLKYSIVKVFIDFNKANKSELLLIINSQQS